MKRLFFGIEALSPWPENLPKGRLVKESDRHLTLAFLGNIPWEPLQKLLTSFPSLSLPLGVCGILDKPLFLPERNPHVIAWHFYSFHERLKTIQKEVSAWLADAGYNLDQRPFLPHVTIARCPFLTDEWNTSFKILPMATGSIHLYESLGEQNYVPIWSHPLLPPFEQIEHTADIAYLIRGAELQELEINALTALAFVESSLRKSLLNSTSKNTPKSNLDEIIISLNEAISLADSAEGVGLKAVSFHGNLEKKDQFFEWEMIVDV